MGSARDDASKLFTSAVGAHALHAVYYKHTMLATINRLMEEAAPPVKVGGVPKPGSRIVSRQPVHQMLTLVPHLTEPQQLLCLRRLRQLLNRSLYNLPVSYTHLTLPTKRIV